MVKKNNRNLVINRGTGISIALVISLILVATFLVGKITALETKVETIGNGYVSKEVINSKLESISAKLQDIKDDIEKIEKKINS